MNKKQRTLIALPAAAALTALGCAAMDSRLKTVTYTVTSDKIRKPVRLAVAADLHGCRYGKNMQTLLTAIRREAPDGILLPGDFFDDRIREDNAHLFALLAAADYPVFYVTGNHEIHSGRAAELKEALRSYGVTVLEGDAAPLSVRGETIWIGGADDPQIGKAAAAAQRKKAREAVPADAFSILLSHRPELVEDYAALGFDAVVAGHAHGGQWRIPRLLNGVYAPHQGIIPAYAGGMYDLGTTKLIVSRGLARETTLVPRICNRPELVILEIR